MEPMAPIADMGPMGKWPMVDPKPVRSHIAPAALWKINLISICGNFEFEYLSRIDCKDS